ncbi:glycoside hydrolase [Lichtheimia hyalospora FSU 10163]|nr:glycoside hydrolase [Lichtheimia hyalospora FSU 10163]
MDSKAKLAATPPMGWNTWNKYGCNINEDLIKGTADIMVEQGYLAAGYEYLNLDDCWQSNERDENGTIIVDSAAFPNGIKALADYVHARGLKFGIYSSAGRETCAGRMASLGYEIQDAATYAEWGVDYLKYDNCNWGENDGPAHERFQTMKDAIDKTGRDMFYSICSWGVENTWEWASQIGQSFRTHDDIYNDWSSIVEIMAVHSKVTEYGGPGHWADPDMLEIGNGRLNYYESKAQMSLWAVMKAPLILGNTLAEMPRELYDIVTNPDIIAVNQDPLGIPARCVYHLSSTVDIWAGPLVNDSLVVVVVNWQHRFGGLPIDVSKDLSIGYHGANITATELWSGEVTYGPYIDVLLAAHEAKVYKFTGGTFDHSKLPIEQWSYYENTKEVVYPAASLNNTIHGLARRRGLEGSRGEDAHIIALGNVNPPETGALTFHQVQGQGVYAMRISYRDCFSWDPCGDKFTRRWNLRVTVNDGEPIWISLRSSHHWLGQHRNRYTMGIVLTQGENNHIHFDNPDGYAPSIETIDLRRLNDLPQVVVAGNDDHRTAFILPPMESGDPLATQGTLPAFGRAIVDYTWEWIIAAMLIIFAVWFIRIIRDRRRKQRKELEYILLTVS